MTDPLSTISTRTTPQTEKADPAQVKSRGGGYTFVADDMNRLRRFLTMGVEGGTFYASEKEVAIESSTLVLDLIATRPADVLAAVIDVSERGAAVRQQPTMFTLAALVAAEDGDVRKAAIEALPRVARTASHLFLFASYVKNFRGWGKGLRKGVAGWYASKDVDSLAYQIEKYGSRYGYDHRNLAMLSHLGSPQSKSETSDPVRKALYARAGGKPVEDPSVLPEVTKRADALRAAASTDEVVALIKASERVSWEMIPAEHLGQRAVWEALLDGGHVPIGALLRNLARLTANGTIPPFADDERSAAILRRLRDRETLTKGRIHPISVLLAAATYAAGQSARGTSTWTPVSAVNKALDAAFYEAFGSIEPEGAKVMIGMDVSGSMDGGSVAGLPLVPRTAAAALGLALSAQFPLNMGVAFTGKGGWYSDDSVLVPFDFDRGRRLPDVIREASAMNFGRTDCALPVLYALERGIHVDAFVILTDNETWAGNVHPHQALRQYREKTGIPARMVTVALVNNPSTIADPNDPLMLDVVGLDSNVVSLVGDFIAGRV